MTPGNAWRLNLVNPQEGQFMNPLKEDHIPFIIIFAIILFILKTKLKLIDSLIFLLLLSDVIFTLNLIFFKTNC